MTAHQLIKSILETKKSYSFNNDFSQIFISEKQHNFILSLIKQEGLIVSDQGTDVTFHIKAQVFILQLAVEQEHRFAASKVVHKLLIKH